MSVPSFGALLVASILPGNYSAGSGRAYGTRTMNCVLFQYNNPMRCCPTGTVQQCESLQKRTLVIFYSFSIALSVVYERYCETNISIARWIFLIRRLKPLLMGENDAHLFAECVWCFFRDTAIKMQLVLCCIFSRDVEQCHIFLVEVSCLFGYSDIFHSSRLYAQILFLFLISLSVPLPLPPLPLIFILYSVALFKFFFQIGSRYTSDCGIYRLQGKPVRFHQLWRYNNPFWTRHA